MVLRGAHRPLEFVACRHLAHEAVRGQQHIVVEENVVDPDDALLAQHDVIGERGAAVHRHAEAKVRVVIEIGARGDDPIDEARLDEWDDRGHAEPRGRHRAGEAHAHGDIVLEHALGEQPASVRQPARVVGQERVIDEVGHRLFSGDRLRIDALSPQEFVLRHRVACAMVFIARKARVRRSRASTIQPRASFGSSVTRKSFRSSGEILPSPATRSVSQSARPRQ